MNRCRHRQVTARKMGGRVEQGVANLVECGDGSQGAELCILHSPRVQRPSAALTESLGRRLSPQNVLCIPFTDCHAGASHLDLEADVWRPSWFL